MSGPCGKLCGGAQQHDHVERCNEVRIPVGTPAFAPLRLAALLGELRLGKPAFGRRLPRRSCDAAKAGQFCQTTSHAPPGQASLRAKAAPLKQVEDGVEPKSCESGAVRRPSAAARCRSTDTQSPGPTDARGSRPAVGSILTTNPTARQLGARKVRSHALPPSPSRIRPGAARRP